MKKVFLFYPVVQKKDIDSLGHVNNEVYLRWLLEAAVAHSNHVGYSLEKFIEMGSAFVVRRHELDYLFPTYEKDQLRIETWTEPMQGARAFRYYEIYHQENNRLILTGKTMWVFVSLKDGRPAVIPDQVVAAFADFQSA